MREMISTKVKGMKRRNIFIERFESVISDDRKAQFGLIVVISFIGMAIVAPEAAPYHPLAQTFQPLQPPGEINYVGTDSLGRDILSRLMVGARISLSIAVLAVSFAAVFGCTMGIIAGYYGGKIDDVIMRVVDVIWAFPFILIAILLVAIFGPGYWNVVVAIGIAGLDDFARISRGEVLAIRREEYILSAKAIGMSDRGIITSEVLPNILSPIIVQFTVLIARAMLTEATLSFLGLGVEPSTPSWGSILGDGRALITQAWWISISAGSLITITVLGINMLGDALRDAFDVEQAGGGR